MTDSQALKSVAELVKKNAAHDPNESKADRQALAGLPSSHQNWRHKQRSRMICGTETAACVAVIYPSRQTRPLFFAVTGPRAMART